MTRAGYDVVLYRSEFKVQVANVLQHLWGEDSAENLSYFEWKYEDNPYTQSPLGIVALHDGKVVGFRGYFASRVEVPERSDNIILLLASDTCVHPDHQGNGLSVMMGSLAKQAFAPSHRLFLNTSCTRNSLPGYQRMGFLPLASKVYMTRAPLLGLTKYILSGRRGLPMESSRLGFGDFDRVLVSKHPRPDEMNSLVVAGSSTDAKIRLFQDADFFRWRFRNPRSKYVFYYLMDAGVAAGYVVMGVSPNNQRGYILDYAERHGGAIRELLSYVIRAKHFNLVSIYDFCVNDTLLDTLEGLGFTTHGLVRIIERRLNGELPLLIRPVKETYAEKDLLVEGLDATDIENWSLKPIFSDAA